MVPMNSFCPTVAKSSSISTASTREAFLKHWRCQEIVQMICGDHVADPPVGYQHRLMFCYRLWIYHRIGGLRLSHEAFAAEVRKGMRPFLTAHLRFVVLL
jgi:hypothetical protein